MSLLGIIFEMGQDVLKTLLKSISSKSQKEHLQDYLDKLSRDEVYLEIFFAVFQPNFSFG